MITYFYHINEGVRERRGRRRLFHHRLFWDFRRSKGFNLEICSGRDFRFEFQRGEAGDNSCSCRITMGLIFFTVFFTFPVSSKLLEHRKCVATWDNDREFYLVQGRTYGFYFYEWAFVWSWHAKVNESSSRDPWWMRQYWQLDEWLLGKLERTETKLNTIQDVYFKLGEKEFKIDSIDFDRVRSFRTYIPFALYHKTWYRHEVKIDKPPMRSGKGENSWDCGDDGTFGVSGPWSGPVPTWENRDECMRLACDAYVEGVLRDARRYGGSKSERGISSKDKYEFIGCKLPSGDPMDCYVKSETE